MGEGPGKRFQESGFVVVVLYCYYKKEGHILDEPSGELLDEPLGELLDEPLGELLASAMNQLGGGLVVP